MKMLVTRLPLIATKSSNCSRQSCMLPHAADSLRLGKHRTQQHCRSHCIHQFAFTCDDGAWRLPHLQAMDRRSGQVVALKLYHMNKLNAISSHQVAREVRLHIGLDHENIISLYVAFQEAGEVVLVQVSSCISLTSVVALFTSQFISIGCSIGR